MTFGWVIISFWVATFVGGFVLGMVGYAITERFKLDRICKRELELRIEYYQREVDNSVLQLKVTQESEGEWDKPPRVTKWKVSDKPEPVPHKTVKGKGWHPEDPE